MNDFDKVMRRIQRVLKTRSSYEVAKALEVNNRTINRYQNGTTPLENMTIGTALKIYEYYEEMIKMEMETLDQAIKDFNEWSGAALIYYNKKEGYFNTEVFANDLHRSQTVLSEDCFGIFSKTERETTLRVGEKRRQFIIEFVELVLDGWEPFQADYQLVRKYGPSI